MQISGWRAQPSIATYPPLLRSSAILTQWVAQRAPFQRSWQAMASHKSEHLADQHAGQAFVTNQRLPGPMYIVVSGT